MKKLILSMLVVVSLPGCTYLLTNPIVTGAQLVSAGVTVGTNVNANSSKTTVTHAHDRIKMACIEWNPEVSVGDFVPTLQNQLQKHGIESRVYDKGMSPSTCQAIINYAAYIEWDKPMFSKDLKPYLSQASLILRQNGVILASTTYQVEGAGMDKWSATDRKVGGMVDRLLVGN